MRDFKLYKSCDASHEDFITGKMLSGVFVKSPDCDENICVCYEERNNSQFMFERVKFNDEQGCSRFNLYYVPLLFSIKKTRQRGVFCESQNEIRKRISGFVIIHSMVTKDQIYKKSNGQTVLTHCWRIRTANGLCGFVPQSSDLCVFIGD